MGKIDLIVRLPSIGEVLAGCSGPAFMSAGRRTLNCSANDYNLYGSPRPLPQYIEIDDPEFRNGTPNYEWAYGQDDFWNEYANTSAVAQPTSGK